MMYIVNDKSLVADGAVESGLAGQLTPGMTVVLEPENDRESELHVRRPHRGRDRSGLAPQYRFLASSSDDGSVILWNLQPLSRLPWLRLERPDLAASAASASPSALPSPTTRYQVLAGYADGSLSCGPSS